MAEETVETTVAQTPASGLSRLASEALEAADEEPNIALADRLKDFASKFLGRRYVWGSTGPKTFDCSGFTSYVFRACSIGLVRKLTVTNSRQAT